MFWPGWLTPADSVFSKPVCIWLDCMFWLNQNTYWTTDLLVYWHQTSKFQTTEAKQINRTQKYKMIPIADQLKTTGSAHQLYTLWKPKSHVWIDKLLASQQELKFKISEQLKHGERGDTFSQSGIQKWKGMIFWCCNFHQNQIQQERSPTTWTLIKRTASIN